MAEFPAMPLWTDAYLGDTTHLTTIEHGAYLLLLMTMWRAGGTLPNDDKRLARFSRLSKAQWVRLKPILMEFFVVGDGTISQRRLTDELAFVKQNSVRQSANAKARWLKTKKTGDAMAMPLPCHSYAPTPTPTPIKKERESKDSRAFSEFWAVYPRRRGKKAAEAKFKAAVKSGVVPKHLIEGARRYAAHCRENKTEERFIKHPQTWLNQGCWDDELKPDGPPGGERRRADDRFEEIMGIDPSGQPASERELAEIPSEDVPEYLLHQRIVGGRG